MTGKINALFSASYAEARIKLHQAAESLGVTVESSVLDTYVGADGEALAIDHLLVSPPGAQSLLVITSGTHGVEGFAGSGCQIGLLRDEHLLAAATTNKVALLVVHAVNPYGFSHLRRANEDNIDLNRNCVNFSQPLPHNPDYKDIHSLLLPRTWPPTEQNRRDIADYYATYGEERFRKALVTGQYDVPDGLFYGGASPSWSHRSVRAIFRRHLKGFRHVAMIDVHTGLGAHGHGEKIFVGQSSPQELLRAKAYWGSDVLAPASIGSASIPVSGPIVALAYEEAEHDADVTTVALEFGTLLSDDVRYALRGDHWLHNQVSAAPGQAYTIKRALRDAFYCDNDAWKGMLFGQFKAAVLQALIGLGNSRTAH
ncbi:M14 family metallopeptidase [Paraburkholderia agricolaris]|uniref:M14 family metallopeptidase n=1 Tax=Paraburkholderia agricolaris TaxID=2152888 RepID=UPI001291E4B3|nr:M14 family metallopeptidase [Paraburkholderia agricolaris]